MGDRCNIVVEFSGADHQRIFLYGHWSGSEFAELLQEALKSKVGRNRWDDEAYLTRIIYDRFVKGYEGTETGFGIAPYFPDNEHDFLVVVPSKGVVRREQEAGSIVKEWSFEEYCSIDTHKVLGDI